VEDLTSAAVLLNVCLQLKKEKLVAKMAMDGRISKNLFMQLGKNHCGTNCLENDA